MTMPIILFATDFGPASEWVGICHAVMARIAPHTRVIDLTHALRPFDVEGAGLILQMALPYAPIGVAALVVDPGVGTQRRSIAVQCFRGDLLIGPDNGLLPAAAESLGGIVAARLLDNQRLHLEHRTGTFDARDVFCPVAAHLASGTSFDAVGQTLAAEQLIASRTPHLEIEGHRVRCEIIDVDGFGNLRLSAKRDALELSTLASVEELRLVTEAGQTSLRRAAAFGELQPDDVGLIVDSFGYLSLCLNRASAAQKFGLARGDLIEIRCS
jgi:S-adenosyl-L-methionine hydrolase (adenosine-forming)